LGLAAGKGEQNKSQTHFDCIGCKKLCENVVVNYFPDLTNLYDKLPFTDDNGFTLNLPIPESG